MGKKSARMNTKFVGHHISSGGFIFHKNEAGDVFVVLIENKKKEYWIPKGHIEPGEDSVDAAFREIGEETGLKKRQLQYIGLCHLHRYSFVDDNGKRNTKEVYMNVFKAPERSALRFEIGKTEIVGGGWFAYEDALRKIIPYSRDQLITAKGIFENYNAAQNAMYSVNVDFERVRKELPRQSFAKDLVCFIVFGSSVSNRTMKRPPGDVDVCVVAKHRSADLDKISEFIFSRFEKPDFRIYFKDEIDSKLQFMDKGVGVFAMEYFANGICLFGKNIFKSKARRLDKAKLKESYLNKIFEYIIRIREVHVARSSSYEYKMWHVHKYVIRLLMDILLYKGLVKYENLKKLSKYDIIALCKRNGIIRPSTVVDFADLEKMYALFREVNEYVVDSHS